VATEFNIPSGNQALGITAGPDGNLWFTDIFSNKIGRSTPAGSISEFTIPTPNSFPWDITTGPDSKLWLTESGGNNIAKVSIPLPPPPTPVPSSLMLTLIGGAFVLFFAKRGRRHSATHDSELQGS
jgi:virginiamycin B lyase